MTRTNSQPLKKEVFVENLKPDTSITSLFQVKDKEIRQKKAGGDYLRLRLGDSTGTVSAMSFQNGDKNWHEINQGDYVLVKARVKEYNDRPQLTITGIRVVDDSDVNSRDFQPASQRDPDEMFDELLEWVSSVSDPHLRRLLEMIFGDQDIARRFRSAPAAKAMHHAYVGGLLTHTLSLVGLCQRVAEHYGPQAVARDLLVSGALLHDIGKAYEMGWQRNFDYTDRGRLLGHIVEEAFLVESYLGRIPGFPEELRLQLIHMILSHHGTYEYGSPRRPKTLEALILHYLDDLDSKCQAMQDLIEAEKDHKGNWTSYSRNLDRYIYKKKYTGEPVVGPEGDGAAPMDEAPEGEIVSGTAPAAKPKNDEDASADDAETDDSQPRLFGD